jgi:hypothetical protein
MALPKAAQRQVDEANRILEAISQPQEEPPAPDLKAVEPAEEPPVEEPPVEEPPVEELPPAAEIVEEPPVEEPPTVDYEQQYRVIQGKYSAEVPRLHSQIRELEDRLSDMQEQMANLTAAPTPEPTMESLVTDAEREAYGEELIDLVGRRAKEVYEPTINTLRSEIAELRSNQAQVSQTVGNTERDRMFDRLDREVEGWQETNNDPRFLDWLNELDAYSGERRGAMLTKAYQENNAARVAAFFLGFKNEHAIGTSSTVDSEDAAEPRTPAVDLEEQVAPGKAPRSPAPASAQSPRRMWTRRQIKEFYQDVAKGNFKSDPDTQRAIEMDITRAISEGRLKD